MLHLKFLMESFLPLSLAPLRFPLIFFTLLPGVHFPLDGSVSCLLGLPEMNFLPSLFPIPLFLVP